MNFFNRVLQNKQLYGDYTNLQNILDEKNNEIQILCSDLDRVIQDNTLLKQEKNKQDKNVKIIIFNFFR